MCWENISGLRPHCNELDVSNAQTPGSKRSSVNDSFNAFDASSSNLEYEQFA